MKTLLHLFLAMALAANAQAQSFNFQLTGNPVNTTGWTAGTQTSINGDEFVLTSPLSNQAGYIYYATPQNLTNCSQFTVSFEFRITSSSSPTADGIAFWYITNPPTGFTGGGGIGMPNNPDGLLLILDTYDNNSTPNNPLVSLRKLDGTSNYLEGSTTGQLAPDLTSQSFITNGAWHTCTLTYNFGTVTVAFDGNPPVMTATTTLSLTGYFGFSAGTGASWANHGIRNVTVSGAPEPNPPAGTDVIYCQGEPAVPLTATGSNLSWFTSPTGGSALPGAPTPSTAVPGIYNFYVSQAITGCNIPSQRDTVIVTVNPKPNPPLINVPKYCSGQVGLSMTVTTGTNVLWYDSLSGGTGSSIIPTVNTATADTFTWYATQTTAEGCESDRIPVTAIVQQTPEPDFATTIGFGCSADTMHFNNQTQFGTSYVWNFGDGLSDTLTNPSHVYNDQAIYYITLHASNAWCSDSITKSVDITHPLEASFTTSGDTICVGASVQFTNTSLSTTRNNIDPSYLWDFKDGNQSVLQSPTHTFNIPGVYEIAMVVTDFVPCTDTAYRTIYVDSLPQISFVRSDTAICAGHTIDFTALYTQNGLLSADWNYGDGPDTFRNYNPAHHAFETPGTYTVSLNGHYRVCPDVAATAQVTIKPIPVINLGPDTAICLDGNAFQLQDQINANDARATWSWSTGETGSSILVKHHGEFSGTVTIDQCSATDVVQVAKDCHIDVPNSFSPDGDGINDYFFPRQFLSNGVAGFRMVIYSRWGQKIFETTAASGRGWDGRFNGKIQPVGVYIYDIMVVMENGRQEAYRGNVTLIR